MLYLERIDPDKNMRRFYRIQITRTLFGEWAVMRRWGRIGCPSGGTRELWYGERHAAENAAVRIARIKRGRGYRLSERFAVLAESFFLKRINEIASDNVIDS